MEKHFRKKKQMKFDSIILDVDGTIWDTTPIVAQAWTKAIDDLFPQVPRVTADILKGQFGKTMDVIGNNLFGVLSLEERGRLLAQCCVEEQIALEHNTVDIAYEGVVSTIRELSGHIPLFIVSNCQSGYIELVIKKNDITDCITDFECFGNNGLTKDNNIRLVVERNRLKAPVYVGDTQGDFEACKAAGVPFVWVEYGFGKVDAGDGQGVSGTIKSFPELLKIF